MKQLFKPNKFFLFDGKQQFVIGEKVETMESDLFEKGMIVKFIYQTSLSMEEICNQMEDERMLREQEDKRKMEMKMKRKMKEQSNVKQDDDQKSGDAVIVKVEDVAIKREDDEKQSGVIKDPIEVKREQIKGDGDAVKAEEGEVEDVRRTPFLTSSTEPTRLLNLINRWRLQKAGFTRLSKRGQSWFDEKSTLVCPLLLMLLNCRLLTCFESHRVFQCPGIFVKTFTFSSVVRYHVPFRTLTL